MLQNIQPKLNFTPGLRGGDLGHVRGGNSAQLGKRMELPSPCAIYLIFKTTTNKTASLKYWCILLAHNAFGHLHKSSWRQNKTPFSTISEFGSFNVSRVSFKRKNVWSGNGLNSWANADMSGCCSFKGQRTRYASGEIGDHFSFSSLF